MNSMGINQCSTILNSLNKQLTGQTSIVSITTPADIVTVAQKALLAGHDPVVNGISQVWRETVFAYRDLKTPGTSLEMSLPRYGNALRKLSPVSADAIDDAAHKYPVAYDSTQTDPYGNGQSVDHYKISKQKVLQTNFYGSAVYAQRYTIFKNQFDTAFNNADEFLQFNQMNMGERRNDWERYRASIARGLQANFIGAIIDENNSSRVVHLLTEYNAESGLALTAQTVYQPANFRAFMQWVFARIKTIARTMGESSTRYQTTIDGLPILRHTSPDNMRIAIYSKAMDQIDAMALANTFHDNYFDKTKWESVNYWQSIETPDTINIKPVYTHTDGTVKNAAQAITQANIFGIIHDVDALGYAITDTWSAATPLNIDGGYWNESNHATIKTIQDNTEKAVVLLLD